MKPAYATAGQLPSAWESRATSRGAHSALANLRIDGTRVKYIGVGGDDASTAAVRANHPIPIDVPLYYFEITVLNKGQHGHIGVGLSAEEFSLNRLPGWDPHSYGYHGDDGHSFGGNSTGACYGPSFTTGDTIGVLFSRADKTVAFYKNGLDLGVAFRNVPETRLFPTVGFQTRDEEVDANFGSKPFVSDFAAMQAEQRSSVADAVAATALPAPRQPGSDLLAQVVFDHLIHHGYSETAAAVARAAFPAAAQLSAAQLADMARRAAVHGALARGDVDSALTALQGCPPLDARVAFKLKCQRFVELVSAGRLDAALAMGRSELAGAARTADEEEHLLDCLSLLAYDPPSCGPSGHLLSASHRQQLAEEVNGAMRKAGGGSQRSALERAYQQAAVALAELRRLSDPKASLIDVRKSCLG